MPVTPALRNAQEAYTKRNLNNGLVRVNLWVPRDALDEIRLVAQELRDEHRKALKQAK